MIIQEALLSAKARILPIALIALVGTFQVGCSEQEFNKASAEADGHSPYVEDDFESEPTMGELSNGCSHATAAQIAQVNLGVAKRASFLKQCVASTNSTKYCEQIARPNPDSHKSFDCTYSASQAHVFVHPDEKTWKYAIDAVKIVLELEKKGIQVATIYNWWRPEPYNKNVGGAAGRHPYGTSVDVRFPSKTHQNNAQRELCKYRAQGRIRAVGYYSGTGLHFGMGDKTANTWGKSCSGGFNSASISLADHTH